jgi:hypothetical protein
MWKYHHIQPRTEVWDVASQTKWRVPTLTVRKLADDAAVIRAAREGVSSGSACHRRTPLASEPG